jgi:hypothetical protein
VTASILPIILWPLIAAGFVALSWRPYRERRFRLVGLVLAAFSIAQGYVSYRLLCSHPLACDAGNASEYLLTFWPHYAVQAALGYGAALLLISDVQRGSDGSLSLRAVVLGVFVVLGASYVAGALLPLIWPWHQ